MKTAIALVLLLASAAANAASPPLFQFCGSKGSDVFSCGQQTTIPGLPVMTIATYHQLIAGLGCEDYGTVAYCSSSSPLYKSWGGTVVFWPFQDGTYVTNILVAIHG